MYACNESHWGQMLFWTPLTVWTKTVETLKKNNLLCSAERRLSKWWQNSLFWMNCPFKFVVFLRSSVWRINGVCRALMMACSRTDANVRCNLLLLITLFFNSPHTPFLSLSVSVPLYFLFTMLQNSLTASCSFLSAVQYMDAWLRSPFFIYRFMYSS